MGNVKGILFILLAVPALSCLAGDYQLHGEFVQGALIFGDTHPDAKVVFNGEPVRVSKQGRFLLGFGRDAKAWSQLALSFADGSYKKRLLPVKQRRYDIQHINGLPSRMVTPDEADLSRIEADNAMVHEVRMRDTATAYFESGFQWPVQGRVSGVFGSQRILNGEPRQPHYGVDIAVPTGTVVKAPAAGRVTLTHPDMYYTGGTIVLDHGHGLTSTFLHLSKVRVKLTQSVAQGDIIAEVGATGRATGPHLDWRMNLFDARIDPQLLVEPMPVLWEATRR